MWEISCSCFFIVVNFDHISAIIIICIVIVIVIVIVVLVVIILPRNLGVTRRCWAAVLASRIHKCVQRMLVRFIWLHLYSIGRAIEERGSLGSSLRMATDEANRGCSLWLKVIPKLVLMALSPFGARAINGTVIFIIQFPFLIIACDTLLMRRRRALKRTGLVIIGTGLPLLTFFFDPLFS